MTNRWDTFSDSELERIANGRASRYEIEQERRLNGLQGAGGEFGSFLSSAGDSLSLGFGDELMGLGAGIGASLSGGDFGSAYSSQAERSRQRLEDAWRYHGGSALAGALVGSLPMGGAIGMAARGARTLRNLTPVQRILSGGLTGAGFGAVYGAGSDNDDRLNSLEGWRNRLMGGVSGAALGAASGAALHGLGMGASHAFRSAVAPMLDPAERAAQELGRAINRSDIPEQAAARGVPVENELARRARDLARMEKFSPGSNPMVMDALGDAGTNMTMVAGARPSAGRRAMQEALEQRNAGARQRVDTMLVRDLGGGQRRTVAQAWEELDGIQQQEAAPLFVDAMRQTVHAVPRELRAFVAFNSRPGSRFGAAVEAARESMRRLGQNPNMTDEAMMRSPRFWHRLQENVSAEVNAVYRASRMTPLGAPRGSAVGEMVQDDQMVNQAVIRMLGGPQSPYGRAMSKYAGAERLREAWRLGEDSVRLDGGEFDLADYARRLVRMSPAEREAARHAAISGLRRELARADTGTGRADVLRAIVGNEAKRNNLRAIFGGEARFSRVLRTLDYERRLFLNYADTNLGRGSPTADKLQGAEQMFGADGSPLAKVTRALGRDQQARYDEQLATEILNLMRTPLTGPNAPSNIQAFAQRRGLLSRALQRAQQQRELRARAGPLAIQSGAVNAIGLSPNEFFSY
ncbi:MAG TPA: hypothetical protein VEA80_04835 [Vitreimonas sp.]|uniref:hypothetical protein n=1 Tax=Vitreimonas sp. TaxID=3069702 RepID=UPI002D582A7C|nr:hypothetical protein [Vitreimonas sp.]HYD86777.1 hypothetical protein [Vitreimonas sp.]